MPNFHTHWLVSLQAIDGLPKQFAYLRDGRDTYVQTGADLRAAVRHHVADVLKNLDLDAAGGLQKTIETRVQEWGKKLRSDPDAICFSAFMLGACGPDFWVLPVDTTGGMIPDVASHHFDLGHYNRTHLQFEVSLKALARGDDLQARVEKAYFLGMATHIGADLVLHELVNVSAGAYNLLKMDMVPPNGTWSNEQGMELLSPDAAAPPKEESQRNWLQRGAGAVASAAKGGAHHVGENAGKLLGDAVPLWTTHNKVEHYWDTWVRYRWLGDFGKRVWPDDVDLNPAFTSLGLPLCDTLRLELLGVTGPVAGMGTTIGHYTKDAYRKVARLLPGDDTDNKRATVYERVNYVLGSVETRWVLEKPLAFPWLFADAVLRGTCKPFIYSRVVDKTAGAYPAPLVFEKAKQEAESGQMDDPNAAGPARRKGKSPPPAAGGRSEKKKLQFFSTERNTAIPASSWNYLNYLTCPAFDRLQKYGKDAFYDRKAFPPFVAAGASAARTFANDLAKAYVNGRRHLPKLGQFWNLDTGLGLRVESLRSPERHQVITRIDWVHVLGPTGIAQAIPYDRAERPAYTAKLEKAPQPYAPIDGWKDDAARAFTVYRGKFPSLEAIVEDPSVVKDRKYLDRILVAHPVAAVASAPVFERLAKQKPDAPDDPFDDALFVEDSPVAAVAKARIPTGKPVELRVPAVAHRLDLVIRASIPRFGAGPGDVAMYLLGDASNDDVQPPADDDAVKDEYAVEWLRKRSKILDRVVEPEASRTSEHSRLATFNARLLVNLSADKTKADARIVKPTPQGNGKPPRLWNDVVPWELHKGHYGRNFAVATARRFTLRGKNRKPPYDFDPTSNFRCLEDLGLTEHCFFTLFPLVKLADGRWIDAFSKEPVTKAAFQKLKKVSAINFVKIVLLYVIDGGGALQLRWCYQDGVRRSVPEVQA
jgi:hypothetical protein